MAQNRSSAVMQQRREPHDSLDDFPTPPWATRALLRRLTGRLHLMSAREPCANRGHMVRPMQEVFRSVDAFDVHDYGQGFQVRDFLWPEPLEPVDWTIMNPPFRLAEQFVARAIETSRVGAAVLVRSAFLEGAGRYDSLFSQTPPSQILQFCERVVMHKGCLAPKGSSATAYCWVVWQHSHPRPTTFNWIAPCRRRLEREDDYPDWAVVK